MYIAHAISCLCHSTPGRSPTTILMFHVPCRMPILIPGRSLHLNMFLVSSFARRPEGYILTLAPAPRLDRDHAAFGRLCRGVVRFAIEAFQRASDPGKGDKPSNIFLGGCFPHKASNRWIKRVECYLPGNLRESERLNLCQSMRMYFSSPYLIQIRGKCLASGSIYHILQLLCGWPPNTKNHQTS